MTSSKSYLFKSLDGTYTDEDRIRAFTNQPLNKLPSYLRPSSAKKLKPPVLHFGWIIDCPILFRYVEDNCPSIANPCVLGGYLDRTISAPVTVPPPVPAGAGAAPAHAPIAPVLAATPINSCNPSPEEWELHDMHQMWNWLTDEYNITSTAAQSLAKECIQQYKYAPGTPFEEYFKQLEALCKAANDVGCLVKDEDLHSQFLMSLSTEYLWILQTHGTHPYAELKCTLLEYDMMVESASSAGGTLGVAPNALVVTSKKISGIVCNN
ncbi:hypothetical protein GYMLUDRAFT_248889 [Collybiopsis luxurians FD-317 M1]|uniref:Uncharacterized protein n=1 Tax=Collybiopsis luxurians FD-317 M1 TaxID=944289 RepID=A0A0D0AWZ7_9AGAR|nr:hypothetical protein GYMLUDRAFT_248889 [Collybiopsis luxurians FD-317 M1]